MHRSFFAVKDTTINSGSNLIDGTTFQDKNVGQDEVLELKKIYDNDQFKYPTRMLIQFDATEVESYISSSVLPSDYKLVLRLFETDGTSGLSEDYNIAAYPLSESWDEGIGKEGDNPKTTIGCSWLNRKNQGGGVAEVTWSNAGGTYISEDEVTQSFSLSSPDIEMDITDMSKKWFGGVNQNHGIILRFSGSSELGSIISSSISTSVSTTTETSQSVSSSIIGTPGGDGSTGSFTVTVADAGGNKYFINGDVTPDLTLLSRNQYRFYNSDSTNGPHPFRFSTGINGSGTAPYSTGVTVVGTQGSGGGDDYVAIDVTDSTPNLYYYCTAHSGMGNEGLLTIQKKTLAVSSSMSSSIVSTSTSTDTVINTIISGDPGAEDLKFFSRQTNTIYSPKLELRWDDHLPATGSNTGSLTALDLSGNTENYVYQLHRREAYKETETVKFRFGARKRYIDKSFTTSIQTVSGSYFAEGSASYSVIDMATNEDVIPFSAYTTMSCDSISPYFTQDLNTFEPNRAYKVMIKVKHNDDQVIVYDDDFEFILRS